MRQIQTAAFGVPEYDPVSPGTYRPRIRPEQWKSLWFLKRQTNKPIAELVRVAIDAYLSSRRGGETPCPTYKP